MEASLLQKYLKIAGAVGLYWAISISLVTFLQLFEWQSCFLGFCQQISAERRRAQIGCPSFCHILPMRVYSCYVQK